MANRMMPGGGTAQAMAPRHPGAPNGMCEYSLLLHLVENAVLCYFESDSLGVTALTSSVTFSDPSSQPDGIAPAQPGPPASSHS